MVLRPSAAIYSLFKVKRSSDLLCDLVVSVQCLILFCVCFEMILLFSVCPEALVCVGRASGSAGREDSYLCSTLGTEGPCIGMSNGR